MSGDAFTTNRLGVTSQFFSQLFDRHLHGRDPTTMEFFPELRPADTRDLGRLALRDDALRVPMRRRRQAHLGGELDRRLAECREHVNRKLKANLCHTWLLVGVLA